MGRRVALIAGAAIALLALSPMQARAQAGAACPIGAPVITAATTYNLTNNDECTAIVFTSPNPVSVTAPAGNTVAPGFQVMLFSVTGGVSVTSSASRINGDTVGFLVGPGQSALLYGDGTNYSSAIGMGFQTIPTNAAFSTANLNRLPGTLAANSGTIVVPPGILQFSDEASFRPGSYPFDVCRNAPMTFGHGASGNPVGSSSMNWLEILDVQKRAHLIPLCAPR